MTRKDYELIVKVFNTLKKNKVCDNDTLNIAIQSFAREFRTSDPRFDMNKFYDRLEPSPYK